MRLDEVDHALVVGRQLACGCKHAALKRGHQKERGRRRGEAARDETAAGLPKASGGWGSKHRERCRDLVKVVAEEAPSGGDGEGADGQPDGRETNQVDAAFSWFRRQRLQRGLGAENPQKCRRKGHEGNSNRRSLERILQAETGLDVGEVEAKPEPGGVETPRVAHERKRGAEYDRYAGS